MIPLFVPGPVTVAQTVLAAQATAPIYHRGEEYGELLRETSAMLAGILGTAGDVYCVSGSGTGTLEMALQNACRPGDRVVVASNGYFGERLAEMCCRLGLDTVHLRAAYADPLPLQQIEDALRTPAAALVAVHHETSTGRVNDLTELGQMCRSRQTLSIVDATSSAGVLPIDMDRNGLDVVITSSQKGLGGTPGVGVLAVSPRAWDRARSLPAPATLAGDWCRVRRAFQRDPAESLWTPPVSVMSGLHAALKPFGHPGTLTEHQRRRAAVGRAIRAGLAALGFTLWPCGAVDVAPLTAAEPPTGIGSARLITRLRDLCGIHVGAGMGPLAGRIVRVSHLGIDLFHVFGLLGAMSIAADRTGNHTGGLPPVDQAWRAFVGDGTGGTA